MIEAAAPALCSKVLRGQPTILQHERVSHPAAAGLPPDPYSQGGTCLRNTYARGWEKNVDGKTVIKDIDMR